MVPLRAEWVGDGTLALTSATNRWEASFTVDGAELTTAADALLCAGLLPAMAAGEGLELEQPVSATLLRNAEQLVDVFAGWWPDELTRVPMVAPVAKERRRRALSEVLVAHSGGVRSLAALGEVPAGLVALVVEGMGEVAPPPPAGPNPVITVHTDLAATLALAGVPAAAAGPSAVLAVVAHALDGFGELRVSSSFGWLDQFAHGSHALTDPLWSGSGTTLQVTDRALDRVACLDRVVRDAPEARPVAADSVLTGAAVRSLGLADRWPDVPPVDLEAVATFAVVGPPELARVAEVLLRVRDDRDPELRAALEAAVRTTTAAGVAWPEGWARVLPELGRGRAS